ncbi:MAG: hypothetical protein KAI53_05385 [Candidatus Aenigmarchaeota archaeon]|nr:hypothetical protein [Candidatus Aenigmarchaeota archaeon]
MIEWTIEKNKATGFSSKTNTLSSGAYFIHRDVDTGFSSKWSGIWAPQNKLFDYFAFKINNTWLSPADVSKATVRPWKVTYSHEPKNCDFEAKEMIFAADNGVVCLLSLKNTSTEKKEFNLVLEAAANIRTKAEDWHERTYNTEFNKIRKCVRIKSSIGEAVFGAGRLENTDINFTNSEEYKDHHPQSRQRCFVPGAYSIKITLDANEIADIPFIFTKNISDFDILHTTWLVNLNKADTVFANKEHTANISTPVAGLDRAFVSNTHVLNSLVNNAFFGQGMFAGYPWFLEFWSRDTLWSAFGLLDAGEFEEVKNLLRTIAVFQQKQIPTQIILDGTAQYYSKDVDPLFLVVLHRYVKTTGDREFAEELKNTINAIIIGLTVKNGLVSNNPEGTWMDSIERPKTAIDIQALWAKALENQKPGEAIKSKLKLFWSKKDRYFYDTYNEKPEMVKTANVLVPLMFGQIPVMNAVATLKTVKSELSSFFGIQTRGTKERDFNPSGYHTGAVWGLTTGWGACAFLNYDMIDDGIECLKALAYDNDRFGIGALSECVDAATGSLLGCPVQGWSSGLLVHATDSYLFGINADMIKKELGIKPKIPDDWGHMYRHGKKIGTSSFDMTIDRTAYGLKIKIVFDEKNDDITCKLTLPSEYVKITVKGTLKTKNFEGSKAKFRMDEFVEILAKKADV